MASDQNAKEPDKTTGNTPVSGTDPGGTRPAPTSGKSVPRPKVKSGDQNRDSTHGTDR